MITREALTHDVSPELRAEFAAFLEERTRKVAFTYSPLPVDVFHAALHAFIRERANCEPPTGTQIPRMLDAAGYLPIETVNRFGKPYLAVRGIALATEIAA